MANEKVATFRERFLELLESSPKTRSTIAVEFGVAKQTVSAWATGQSSPRLPVVNSLADYFGVSFGWLMGYDVPKYIDREALSRYESEVSSVITNNDRAGLILDDELDLLLSYRQLTARGQQLLRDRVEELKLLYGKKSESDSAQSV